MGVALRYLLLIGILSGLGSAVSSQTAPPAHKAATSKHYCQPDNGFCFRYPASWTVLGEVFNGNGVVVAPEQKQDRSLWDEITAALIVPAPEGDEESPGLNGIVEQAMTDMREAGQNFVTLQRQERTVDHNPAQMFKAQYRDKSTGHDWIEEVIFIQGPQNQIYSVALKCAPQNLVHLEPALAEVLHTWNLPQPEPAESAPSGNGSSPHSQH